MAVSIEKFEEVVSRYPQLKMVPLSAFYKIEAGAARMYIARTKRVSRVDVSGFHFSHPAVIVLDADLRREKRKGRVEAQLDFTMNEHDVLDAFETGLKFMLSLTGENGILETLPDDTRREVEHFRHVLPARRSFAQQVFAEAASSAHST